MRIRIEIEIEEAEKPPHRRHEPQGLRVPITCVSKGYNTMLSNAVIPVSANVGDIYTFGPGIGEDDTNGVLVAGPAPASVTPYLAGPLTATTSDQSAISLVPGTTPETFVATILAVPTEPFVAVTFSDGITAQELDFTISSLPIPAPGATGLLVPFVKTSGP